MLEVSKKQAVKTRREHECYGCCEIIEKGAAAIHVRGKEDGRYRSLHLHIHCHVTAMKNDLFVHGFTRGAIKDVQQKESFGIAKTSYPF